MAEVTDVDEGTVLYPMSLMLAPETFITELVACPVPWAVDSLLDVRNLARVQSGCGRCEGVGNVLQRQR